MMRLALYFFVCLVAASPLSVDEQDWQFYKRNFNKKYDLQEETARKEIFLKNRDEILQHNRRFKAGLTSYRTGINHFTDFSEEEIRSHTSCVKVPSDHHLSAKKYAVFGRGDVAGDLPKHVDWREKGAVSEVKDQGQCGSCWTFSVTGTIEGSHFLKTGELVSLSEQNIIDCDRTNQTFGCKGGWMLSGLEFVMEEGGIDTEESYPYVEGAAYTHPLRTCRYNESSSGARVSSVFSVADGMEDLMAAVATHGPISVGINVDNDVLYYSSGVLKSSECFKKAEINHGVLLVGYGTDPVHGDYWLVKNSWDTTWGEEGYIRLARGYGYDCMIESYAFFVK